VRVKVLFFGQLKDIAGRSEDSAEVQAGATLESLFDYYAAQFPRMRDLRPSIVIARNQQFAHSATPMSEGDEIAFLPPVSGGSNREVFELTREPIDTAAVRERVLTPEDGAVVVFEGVVRNNTRVARQSSSITSATSRWRSRTMEQLGREIAASYAITSIAMVHRLGVWISARSASSS
jgi:molybdopterin synthase catalytic subunit